MRCKQIIENIFMQIKNPPARDYEFYECVCVSLYTNYGFYKCIKWKAWKSQRMGKQKAKSHTLQFSPPTCCTVVVSLSFHLHSLITLSPFWVLTPTCYTPFWHLLVVDRLWRMWVNSACGWTVPFDWTYSWESEGHAAQASVRTADREAGNDGRTPALPLL